MKKDIKTLKYLKELSKIPSTPFLPKLRIDYITTKLKENNINFQINDYVIIANNNADGKFENKPKLVFMTHLDHPGMALNDEDTGQFFGSIGLSRLNKTLAKKDKIPIKVVDPENKTLGTANIKEINKMRF